MNTKNLRGKKNLARIAGQVAFEATVLSPRGALLRSIAGVKALRQSMAEGLFCEAGQALSAGNSAKAESLLSLAAAIAPNSALRDG